MENNPTPVRPTPKARSTPKSRSSRSSRPRMFRSRGSRIWKTLNPIPRKTNRGFDVISPEQSKYFDGLRDTARVKSNILSRGKKFRSGAARDSAIRGVPDIETITQRCSSIENATKYLQDMGILKGTPRYVQVFSNKVLLRGSEIMSCEQKLFFVNICRYFPIYDLTLKINAEL